MVVLAAALVGAAGYGVYRGGEEAVKQTKQTRKEMKRESNRKSQRQDLSSKSKERSERIARLAEMRSNASTRPTNTTSSTPSVASSSWPLSSSATPQETPAKSSTVDDRYNNVLGKLRNNPNTGVKKPNRLTSLFKRK
jgi:hypothetical protein